MEVLARSLGFTEGPVVRPSGALAFVSVDGGQVFELEEDGRCEVVANLGGGPNGLAEGADGALYVARSGRRLIGMTSHPDPVGGGIDVLEPSGELRRLATPMESPNDLCVGPDGLLYVTDPTRPLGSRSGRVWRCDPGSGACELLAEMAWYTNGIGFDADDRLLVANSDDSVIVTLSTDGPDAGQIEVVARLSAGRPDGLALDDAGNLLVAVYESEKAGPGAIEVFGPDGSLAARLPTELGHLCTNVCLDDQGTLYVTVADAGAVARSTWPHPALPLHPFRGARSSR